MQVQSKFFTTFSLTLISFPVTTCALFIQHQNIWLTMTSSSGKISNFVTLKTINGRLSLETRRNTFPRTRGRHWRGLLAAGGHDWVFHDKSLPFITPRSHVTQRLTSSRPFLTQSHCNNDCKLHSKANYSVGWSDDSGFNLWPKRQTAYIWLASMAVLKSSTGTCDQQTSAAENKPFIKKKKKMVYQKKTNI